MRQKRGFEFSFAWLFAILAGAFILFLAVYISIKIINAGDTTTSTTTAKQFAIFLEQMETGIASGKKTMIKLNEDAIIKNECNLNGNFGKNLISLAGRKIGKKWGEFGIETAMPNKYVFSNSTLKGKDFFVFSKPIEMPFKISELIFLYSDEYCFINTPEFIKEDVKGLGLGNIGIDNCTKGIKVCFESGNCEINVEGICEDCENEYEYGFVNKNGKSEFYYGNLIYGAIFSDKDNYECNAKRLMKRMKQQAGIFAEEATYLSGSCGERVAGFAQLAGLAGNVDKSGDMFSLLESIKEVELENEASECKLF